MLGAAKSIGQAEAVGVTGGDTVKDVGGVLDIVALANLAFLGLIAWVEDMGLMLGHLATAHLGGAGGAV